ncbi:MAG: hypothetical protein OEV78_05710, partial [Spirochaetia bacterium]|nr:hypothetical protein [Spirochaetia bacterium]
MKFVKDFDWLPWQSIQLNKRRIILFILGLVFSSTQAALYAEDMQKVIILPFKNINKNANYEYLEASITDSIRENLKTKFAFSETSERDW